MTDIRSSIKQDTLKDLESYLCFRRALRREDQRVLDNLYQKASLNFVAAQSVDHALPFEILLLSMLLEEHNKVKRHRHQVDEVLHETKAGKRQLKLGEASMAQLAAQREVSRWLKPPPGIAGRRMISSSLQPSAPPLDNHRVMHEFKKILRKAGLPNIRFHDLRHTSITLLLEMGTPVNTVHRCAGHSKASVTTDIYGHASVRGQEQAAEAIEDLVIPIAVKLHPK